MIKADTVVTNIDNILNFSDENLLQTDAIHPVYLHHLDDIVERVTSRGYTRGIDVNKVITALRGRKVYHQPSHRTLTAVFMVVLAGLGILWSICFVVTGQYYPRKWECKMQPKPLHAQSL
jgi:hypothetical protein